MNKAPLFITSTGTGQGKTYVTRLLCMQSPGLRAIKPVISGYEAEDATSDTALIESLSAIKGVENCSPWRFRAPISPDLAAQREGKAIDFAQLVDFCHDSHADIIEGAGGIMSPLTTQHTNLDLAVATHSRALLVSSLYLGCISHILSALAVLKQQNVPIAGLILSANSIDNMDAETVLASLTPQLSPDLPIFILQYDENFSEGWKNQPDLTSVTLAK